MLGCFQALVAVVTCRVGFRHDVLVVFLKQLNGLPDKLVLTMLELLNDLSHLQLILLGLEHDILLSQHCIHSIKEQLGIRPLIQIIILDILLFYFLKQLLPYRNNLILQIIFLVNCLTDDQMCMHQIHRYVTLAYAADLIFFFMISLLLCSMKY